MLMKISLPMAGFLSLLMCHSTFHAWDESVTNQVDPDKIPIHLNQRKYGLGLSGGGMRANAFHLGLLRGLHRKRILRDVKLLSGVSGGSWAAAAYKTAPMDDDTFFNFLDACVKIYDRGAPSGTFCSLLKESQVLDSGRSPNFPHVSLSGRQWQAEISAAALLGEDVPLSDLADPRVGTSAIHRPELILGGTHAVAGSDSRHNIPIEMTRGALYIPVVGCGPGGAYCKPGWLWTLRRFLENPLHRIPLNWMQFRIETGGIRKGAGLDQQPQFSLSDALALSSAVNDAYRSVLEIRKPQKLTMNLTDGGFSDNLALVPLVRRWPVTIILSDASSDTRHFLEDFKTSIAHAKRIYPEQSKRYCFDNKINAEWINRFRMSRESIKMIRCPDSSLHSVFYIKTKSFYDESGFENFLLGRMAGNFLGHPGLHRHWKEQHTFPVDGTVQVALERKQVALYYLYGQFMAEKLYRCIAFPKDSQFSCE